MKKAFHTIWEIVEVFLIAVIAVAAIKYFLIQPFIVNGASMEPTFYDGDYLLVDEITYKFKDPARGDVIVFHSPQDYSVYFIKRIIGLPGEQITVDKDKVTIVNSAHPNGFVLTEPYIHTIGGISNDQIPFQTVKLKANQYFVMGDNRLNSLDSRYWGPLEKNRIVGIVKMRLWPLSDITFFNHITYPL